MACNSDPLPVLIVPKGYVGKQLSYFDRKKEKKKNEENLNTACICAWKVVSQLKECFEQYCLNLNGDQIVNVHVAC